MTPPATLQLIDSRRITGAHLVLDGAGALIDVSGPDELVSRTIECWRKHARAILNALDWSDAKIGCRLVPGGASFGFTAPIDALYAATEVNEWAWRASLAECAGIAPESPEEATESLAEATESLAEATESLAEATESLAEATESLAEATESLAEATGRLRQVIDEEANPALIALSNEASRRGLPWVSDDDDASIGLGCRSRTWPVGELPGDDERESESLWHGIGDIPVLVVTGTNGKTTTIRLLASIARAAGVVVGFTSTDGVYVGGELVATGDYSGPGGARMVVRDHRVEMALLETARGGLLRRGLPLARATAAAVTNVAADHLGEFGVHNVDAIADTKLTVSRLVGERRGALILNADDSRLLSRGLPWGDRVTWVTLRGDHPEVVAHREAGGFAATLEGRDGEKFLTLWSNGEPQVVAKDAELPITFGGAAHYNIANSLTAAALALQAGIEIEAISEGLRAFEPTPENSPGRGNWFEVDGVQIYIDFAHNPHGFEAMSSMVSRLPYVRLGVILGQAGDRDDASIRELTGIAWRLDPARIVIKDMPEYFRGREPGEVPALIEDELRKLGVPEERISRAATEGEAVEVLRAWAKPGDLLLLPLHAERDAVIASLRR